MPQKLLHKVKNVHVNDAAPQQQAKPFLKWAGGKSQLLQKFRELYPQPLKDKKIKNYYEPFLGSGAVFFDIARLYEIEHAYLYDVNEELVITYKVLQKDVALLTATLYKLQQFYNGLTLKKRTEYYYELREKYNRERLNFNYKKYSENWVTRASQLIFLNKTCFNGLYRVNSKGEFNTPAGLYQQLKICDEVNLLAVSKILQIATIKKADYKQVKQDLKANSFVYFDPPYRPISKTAGFTAYSNLSFQDNQQIELSELFKHIHESGELVMLSNSDPKNHNPHDNFFDDLYKDFHLIRIPAKRIINSNAARRGNINEIVVTNYKADSK